MLSFKERWAFNYRQLTHESNSTLSGNNYFLSDFSALLVLDMFVHMNCFVCPESEQNPHPLIWILFLPSCRNSILQVGKTRHVLQSFTHFRSHDHQDCAAPAAREPPSPLQCGKVFPLSNGRQTPQRAVEIA